ncbi:C2H2 zinc finger protein [Musa troglodytarum]|uniref:C2H2 zinc finger protein n=1 Tax=Musa troglodytarum TaxID=320322 RepID=A0A9E7EJD7_9LILI|nr:C2H2 zinc finger protein [Musa troglodytarum]
MAMVMDQQQPEQQQAYKHYCRICKKGFGCGRALGGHMRAHGIIDDSVGGQADVDDDTSGFGASEWDDKLNNPAAAGTKRMYALRTNPNRLKSCRICENCGKEFLSWKSFLEHGKCSSEEEGDDWFPSSPRSEAEDDLAGRKGCAGWSKGKRSRRTKVVLSEEEDLANCLVMLSAARVEPVVTIETEESCASASKEDDRRQQTMTIAATAETPKAPALAPPALPSVPRGMFECKACKKVFTSHQALGGHRASHKKVKGCFAAKLEALDEALPYEEVITHEKKASQMAAASMSMAIVPYENSAPLAIAPLKKKPKLHECSICHRVFTSGQALGGHKRCHWITSNSPEPSVKLQPVPDHANLHHQLTLRPMFDTSNSEPLDLNMPAPVDDVAGVRRDIGSSLRLEMPAAICLRSWIDRGDTNKNRATTSNGKNNDDNHIHSKDNNTEMSSLNVDDEADSKVKLALSDLKDINMGGESSPWLQVGIGSSANEGREA